MIHRSKLLHNLVRRDNSWQTSTVGRKLDSTSGTFRLPDRCGRWCRWWRHLSSPLQPLCVGLFHYQFWYDVLCQRLHVAGLCSPLFPASWQTTHDHLCDVGRPEATSHCSQEIQRNTVHFGHLPVPASSLGSNLWWDSFVELNPLNPGRQAGRYYLDKCPLKKGYFFYVFFFFGVD